MEWSQVVTWLLVILGWWLVNRQNNIREKRKEIRAFIDKLQNSLDELESHAIKYHTSEKSDDLAFSLKRSLNKKIPNKIALLKSRNLDMNKCYPYMKQLRQAITLENFDTANFHPRDISDDLLKKIWLSKENLSHEIEMVFSKKYP